MEQEEFLYSNLKKERLVDNSYCSCARRSHRCSPCSGRTSRPKEHIAPRHSCRHIHPVNRFELLTISMCSVY